MRNKLIILYLFFSIVDASASVKEKIVQNLKNTENLTFNFEQNVNGKTENGYCALSYPKKIFCRYNLKNNKILVSNGKSLVIKTQTSFYRYPLNKTPLNLILDKKFLIKNVNNLKEKTLDGSHIIFEIEENDNEINVFFDYKTFNLIGWQTKDIYQNLNVTYLSSILKNQQVDKNLFTLPKQN